MKIDWIMSKDNSKALLNNGDLEVQINKISDIEESKVQNLSNKYKTRCGFIKIESGNIYECNIIKNNMKNILDELDIETASKLLPKLFSSLGDAYEEK